MARFWLPSNDRPSFAAEAVTPNLSRRGFLGGACACCAVLSSGASGIVPAIAQAPSVTPAPARPIHAVLDKAAAAIQERMLAWRRDIHANPELGNREVRTAALVAKHLRDLGYEVKEKVAVTGVVGLLKGGGGDGPVVALRADMDALPVTEQVDLPFASKVRTRWAGEEVGVMHACGHDCHVAIQMAVAEVVAGMKAELKGTIKLIFQPAEEGLPEGEKGGARMMVEEGVLADPKPDIVLGLHVSSAMPAGNIGYRPGPTMASSDSFKIVVRGRQTHGAIPWGGVDPIVIGSTIVSTLQTIISRESNIVADPAVLTVGMFRGGVRRNIVPEMAELEGTLRTYNPDQRTTIMRRAKEIVEGTAQAMNGRAEIHWSEANYPVLVNDRRLTGVCAPVLARVTDGKAIQIDRVSASEDFSFFAQQVPSFFFFVGIAPVGSAPGSAPPNHSPRFRVEEQGLMTGLRAMLHLVADQTGTGA